MNKCHFAREQLTFLEYSISSDGFGPPPAKVVAITNFARPKTIMELSSFLGRLNYYHSLILRTAESQAPLTDLFRRATKKDWRPVPAEQLAALERCKENLATVILSNYLADGTRLTLTMDACSTSIGAQPFSSSTAPVWFLFQKAVTSGSQVQPVRSRAPSKICCFETLRAQAGGTRVRRTHRPQTAGESAGAALEKASTRQLRQLDYISEVCLTLTLVDALSRVEVIDMPTI